MPSRPRPARRSIGEQRRAEVVAIVAAARVPLPSPPGAPPGLGREWGNEEDPHPRARARSSAPREVAPCTSLPLSTGRAPPEARRGFAGPAGCKAIAAEKAGCCYCLSPQPRQPSPAGEGTGPRSPSTARTRTPGCTNPASAPHGLPALPRHLPLPSVPARAEAGGQRRAAAVAAEDIVCWINPQQPLGF